MPTIGNGVGRIVGLVAVAVILPFAFLTACAGVADLGPGDCAKRVEDGSLAPAACDDADAEFQVLGRSEDSQRSCIDVAGATTRYRVPNEQVDLCLGPRDVDPATAVNTAQPGDCLTRLETEPPEGQRPPHARRVDCAAPEAVFRVIARVAGDSSRDDECAATPGAGVTYAWWIQDEPAPADHRDEIVLCLSPKDVDPQTSPDLAQVGDCMGPSDATGELVRTDCANPRAQYRVLHRDDHAPLGAQAACRGVRGAVGHFYKPLGGARALALCLGAV